MKLKDLKENQVVQTTAENDKQFRELLHEEGFKWYDNTTYIERSMYGKYETMCYNIITGTFCSRYYYENEGKEILQASEFLTPKIKKSELKMEIEDLKEEVSNLRETLQYLIDETKKITIVHPPTWANEPSTVIGKGNVEVEADKPHRDVLGSPFQKPEFTKPAEQPQFEVGKVYKGIIEGIKNVMFYCTEINNKGVYGFGFCNDDSWCEIGIFCFDDSIVYIEATPEEWFKRLEEEAKKRGFVKGVIVNGKEIEGTFFNIFEDELYSYQKGSKEDSVIIMKDGKWAEIIEEPQYKIGTIGIFWDGDFEEKMSRGNVIFGELDHITENGHFRRKGAPLSWQNFKPIKID